MSIYTKHAFLFAAMTEYGWKRDNGRLEIHWEIIEKAKSSFDFILCGCKCKTGLNIRICSCRRRRDNAEQVAIYCQFCTNNRKTTQTNAPSHEIDLLVDELIQESDDGPYVDDSDDDLVEWRQEEMDDDDELCTLMEFVFSSESDKRIVK